MSVKYPAFAARLNSFKTRPDVLRRDGAAQLTIADQLERAASVEGLTQVDLNFPDHLQNAGPEQMSALLNRYGLTLNGLAMRYYADEAFAQGAFTNPNPAVRQKAIDLTKQGIDALVAMGGDLMTIWLGQDGFDYPFHVDYAEIWELELAGVREVVAYNPAVRISIEYKPNEPRAFSLLADLGTTLLALRDINAPNLGVTLDFAHVIYADEMPAASAGLIQRYSQLFGVHLNDGYGKRDDGLMVASVHILQTLELLYVLQQTGYNQVIYFDTFPEASGLDPVRECTANIRSVRRLLALLDQINLDEMRTILHQQDVIRAHEMVHDVLFPAIRQTEI